MIGRAAVGILPVHSPKSLKNLLAAMQSVLFSLDRSIYRQSILLTSLFLIVAMMGCGDAATGPMADRSSDTQSSASTSASTRAPGVAPASGAAEHTYSITITNLTDGQPLSPPLLVTHTSEADLFEVGEPAGPGIEGVAETGAPAGPNTQSYLEGLQQATGVYAAIWATSPGPIPPGEGNSRTYEVTAAASANLLSAATMLVCTNDGFTGLDGLRLPHGKKAKTVEIDSYDAGTEVNTEARADLVVGCKVGSEEGRGHGKDLSAGTSQNGTITTPHPGVDRDTDGDDVLGADQNWGDDPVARIRVERQLPQ